MKIAAHHKKLSRREFLTAAGLTTFGLALPGYAKEESILGATTSKKVAVPTTHSGRTIFVDEIAGNDSNSGESPEAAVATMKGAYAVMTPPESGNVIIVMPEEE